MIANVRRPSGGAGADGESASAATHGRIQSRWRAPSRHGCSSSSMCRSKIANSSRASRPRRAPKTGADDVEPGFAPTSSADRPPTSARASRASPGGRRRGRSARTRRRRAAATARRGSGRRRSHASPTKPRRKATMPPTRRPSASRLGRGARSPSAIDSAAVVRSPAAISARDLARRPPWSSGAAALERAQQRARRGRRVASPAGRRRRSLRGAGPRTSAWRTRWGR